MIMRSEIVLRWVALGSAIVLLFAPVGERTYWEQWGQGISRVYDSTPYDFLALLAGVVALFSLVAALLSLPHRRPMVLGIAAAAFAVTAASYGFYWMEASRGVFRSEGQVYVPEGWTVHPMTGYREFTIAAGVGAASALVLAINSLRQRDGK
jgi:hypothetical protein